MIVNSSGLESSEDLEFPLSHPIIGHQNVVTTGNIVADTEDPDFPASNLANPSTALRWQAVIGSPPDADQFLTVTTGATDDIDYLAVVRHNFGSEAITVSVEGRADIASSPTEPFEELIGETVLTDDDPVIFRWEPQTLAEVRLRMQAPGSTAPTAAVVYVGKLLVMERSFPVAGRFTPFPLGRQARLVEGFSEGGQFLGRIVLTEHRESEVEFEYLRPSWFRTNFDPFLEAALERPFFFAWEPDTYPAETGYAWLSGDRMPLPEVDPVTGRMSISLPMTGLAV